MKKVLIILLAIILIACVGVGGTIGFLWYRDNHVFVGGKPYSIHAVSLDLREEDLSREEYDSLHAQLPNCEIAWLVPFQDQRIDNGADAITITTLTREDLDAFVAALREHQRARFPML